MLQLRPSDSGATELHPHGGLVDNGDVLGRVVAFEYALPLDAVRQP